MKECVVCRCVKPPRAHHCSKCNRCVLRMDHHCKWVANCIGQRNMKLFLNFVGYLSVYLLQSMIVFAKDGIGCIMTGNSRDKCQETVLTFGFVTNLIITCITNDLRHPRMAWRSSFYSSAYVRLSISYN